MAIEIKEEWSPMPPNMGPPLPRSMQVYWPWYKPSEVPPEAPIYACPYCAAEFSTQTELYAHIIKAHAGQPPKVSYMCPYCGAKFDSLSDLQAHMTSVHPPAPPAVYTCTICGATFATQAELNYHMATAHPKAPPEVYTCTICGATFATQAELNYHMATAHPKAPPPPEADIKDVDFKLTKGTYDMGARMAFTAPYDYKGMAQDGQLTISIGTGLYPTFNPIYTYEPIPVRFEAAADWQTRGLDGSITLPDVLEPGQAYSVRAKLETLTMKTQEIDTDWSAFDIKTIAVFTFSNVSAIGVPWSFPSSWRTMNWFCTITNPNNAVVTKTLKVMLIYYANGSASRIQQWWEFELTLDPNQAYTFNWYGNTKGQRADAYNGPEMGPGDHICMWLEDLEGNKSPEGCAYY